MINEKTVYAIREKSTGKYYYRGHSGGSPYELNDFSEDFKVIGTYQKVLSCFELSSYIKEHPENFEIVALTLRETPVVFNKPDSIPKASMHKGVLVDEAVNEFINSIPVGDKFEWQDIDKWTFKTYPGTHYPELHIRQALNRHKRKYSDFVYIKKERKNQKIRG